MGLNCKSMLKGIWCEWRCEKRLTTYAKMERVGANIVQFQNGPLEISKGTYDLTVYEDCKILTDAVVKLTNPTQKIELITYTVQDSKMHVCIKLHKGSSG